MVDTVYYAVSSSTASTGPWTAVAGSPFTSPTDTITGLTAGTSYYFQIIPQDKFFNISGPATVVGPYTTTPVVVAQESAQGTVLTSTTGQIVDLPLNVWTLKTSTSSGLQVYENGVLSAVTNNVITLLYWNSTVYYQKTAAVSNPVNAANVGTVAGSPGTLPTNWSTQLSGTTQTIVGFGSSDPTTLLPYIDIQFSGSASTDLVVNFTTSGLGLAVNGNTNYTFSLYLAIKAGIATPAFGLNINESNSNATGSPFVTTDSLFFEAVSGYNLTSTPVLFSNPITTQPSTNYVDLQLVIQASGSTNVTYRISSPAFLGTGTVITSSWNYWNGSGWTTAPGDPRLVPSINGTQLTSPSGQIIDSSLNVWNLQTSTGSGLQIYENGVLTNSSNVILLLYYNGLVYQENSNSDWWYWSSSWIPTTNPLAAGNSPSPNGTTVTNTTSSIIDSLLDAWTLVSTTSPNLISNTTNAGAVVGTPGTFPTNWGNNASASGYTFNVVGFGPSDAQTKLPYIDIQISGTSSVAPNIIFALSGLGISIPYSAETTYLFTLYLAVQSGTPPSPENYYLYVNESNSNTTNPSGSPFVTNDSMKNENLTLSSVPTLIIGTFIPQSITNYIEPYFAFPQPESSVTYRISGVSITTQSTPSSPNLIPNSSNVGAIVPSTFPNGWTISTDPGVKMSVVGFGTDTAKNLPYIEVSFVGTAQSTGAGIAFGNIPAAPSQNYILNYYLSIVGGSNANISLHQQWNENNSTGGYISGSTKDTEVSAPTSTLTQWSVTGQTTIYTAYISPNLTLSWNSGSPINATYKIEGIQLQAGTSISAYELTPTASGMQVAENGTVNTTTSNVNLLLYWNGIVYYENTTPNWYYWNEINWLQVSGDPRSSVMTWNPYDMSSSILLSNGNLTATSVGAISQSIRSQVGYQTGSYYFEITIKNITTDFCVGVASSSYALNSPSRLGGDPTSIGFFPKSQTIYVGNTLGGRVGVLSTAPGQVTNISLFSSTNTTLSIGWTAAVPIPTGGDVNGNVVSCAVNFTNQLIWFSSTAMRAQGLTWNFVNGANPASGVGGITFNLGEGPFFIAFNDDLGTASATVNFGATAFTEALPTNFSAWGVSSMATLNGATL